MIASVASGLGGRFFDEFGATSVRCATQSTRSRRERRVAGVFGAYIATSPHQEEAARDGLLAEFRQLREEPVTADELERAQRYAIGVHAIRQQSGGAVLADLVDDYLFGTLAELTEHDARVSAVTAESMQRVAEMYFDPSRQWRGSCGGGRKRKTIKQPLIFVFGSSGNSGKLGKQGTPLTPLCLGARVLRNRWKRE